MAQSAKSEKPSTKNSNIEAKHLGISSLGWKLMIIFILLGLLGAMGYFTYTTLSDDDTKVPPTTVLAGLVIGYIALLSVFGLVIYMIVTDEFDNAVKEFEQIRVQHTGVYILLWITILFFLFVFFTIMYSVFAEEPPLGIQYTRPAPPGTQLGKPLKHPSEYS